MRSRLIHLAAALAVITLQPATAQPLTKVVFGQVSPTATGWPGMIAKKKGFFASNGVEMDTVSIGVSPGMQAVASGSLDVMHNTVNAIVSFIEFGRQRHKDIVGDGCHASWGAGR